MSDKTWWLVVKMFGQTAQEKHWLKEFVCQCEACGGREKGGHFPSEGFAILAFDDGDRAKMYAKISTTGQDRYEAIEVVRRTVG